MIPDWLIYQSIYTFLVSFVSFLLGVASKTTKVVMKDDDLDRIAKSLAARLSDEPVKLDDSEMDKFARKCAKAWNEIPYDNTPDDELFARIEKLAREIAWEQTDVFAAKVMELADQRRAERERAQVAHPVNATAREWIENAVFAAYVRYLEDPDAYRESVRRDRPEGLSSRVRQLLRSEA